MEPSNKTYNDYYNDGRVLSSFGRYQEALSLYNEALRLNPRFTNAHIGRGNVFYHFERYEEALASFEEALRLHPQDEYAHMNRGAALSALGRYQEALRASDEALRLNPCLAEAYNNRGLALRHLGHLEEALTAFDEALRLKPLFALAHRNRADVLNALGRYQEALKASDEALWFDPQVAATHCQRGIALQCLGRYREALGAYNEALRIHPNEQDAAARRNEVEALLQQLASALPERQEFPPAQNPLPASQQPIVQHTVDHRPTLAIQLRYGQRTISCEGLIDSGASYNLFPATYARQLGIDLTKARRRTFSGIKPGKEAEVIGYEAVIEIGVNEQFFRAPVYFSDDLDSALPGLLGQAGFFDRFTVAFDTSSQQVTITNKETRNEVKNATHAERVFTSVSSEDMDSAKRHKKERKPGKEATSPSTAAPSGQAVLGVVDADDDTKERVLIKKSTRPHGVLVVGTTGFGKSGLLENLIVTDILQRTCGVLLLDPHGDLTQKVIARTPQERIDNGDIIVLDIANIEHPFGLNLFVNPNPNDPLGDEYAVSKVMHVFKRLWGKGGVVVQDAWGLLLEEILRNTTRTFLEVSHITPYTMAEIPMLLEEEKFRDKLVPTIRNRHVRNYWLNWYNQLKDKDQLQERRSTLNRVKAFLTRPIVENIVGQVKTTINLREIMDTGKVLLIRLDQQLEDVAALICSMIVAELLSAAYSRENIPFEKRRQFHAYFDEFQLYATEDLAKIVKETRKYGICCTLATQTIAHFTGEMESALDIISNIIAFQLSIVDAEKLARKFDDTPKKMKKVLRQRTKPVYKEWDEEVWVGNGEALYNEEKERYRKREAELWQAVDDVNAVFDGLDFKERYDNCLPVYMRSPLIEYDDLVAFPGTHVEVEKFVWHAATRLLPFQLFVPYEACGMLYSQSKSGFFDHYQHPHSLVGKSLGGLRQVRDGWEHYIFPVDQLESILAKVLGDYPRSNGKEREVIDELRRLTRPYYERGFWFRVNPPYDNPGIRPFTQADRGRERGFIEQRTTGDKTSVHEHARWPEYNLRSRFYEWPELGQWKWYDHPPIEAVKYLISLAQGYETQEAIRTTKIEEHRRLEEEEKCAHAERVAAIYATYRKTVHHKEYLGQQPDTVEKIVDEHTGRTKDVQWYDEIEETDETRAQRRDDIASELANLPKFTAKIRLAVEEKDAEESHKIVEYKVKTIAPDRGIERYALQQRLAQIRKSNIAAGYLRASRQEVENEIIARQEVRRSGFKPIDDEV